jgi:thiol-disulfide isomerase/thioredoxin
MADEDVFVEGDINDFPNNLTVTGSVHHNLKVAYDKRIADYDKELTVHKSKIAELQQQNLWNDSLQQKYIGENGILREINAKKTEVEKQFIADHIDTYYAMQILYYKKSNYKDRKLKKIFSKFSKELQSTKNGKAIQAYLNNPEIKKGEKYTDFEALSRDGSIKKLSEQFDGKKYVLLDFSTPTCPHSQKAIPMLQDLNEKYKEDLNIVTFYTESKQEHFDYISNLEKNTWQFLWTKEGEEGFPYKRYRINSTPTYYLFSLEGKLIEKWSGFQQGYYDATQSKIEKLIGVK